MGNKSKQSSYLILMAHIKDCTDQVDQRRETLNKALAVLQSIELEKINIDEMCHCHGLSMYRHNLYLMDVFYLFLGECYDFALDEDSSNYTLAKKYYTTSNQPAAKWRLAKMYLDKKLRYDGDVNVVAGRLIVEAINGLINELGDLHYFEKKLSYLADMYQDLHPMGYPVTYYDILRWIVANQEHLKPEHTLFLTQLCEFDVPPPAESEQDLLDKIYALAV